MHIDVGEKLRHAGRVDIKDDPRCAARPGGVDSQKDEPTGAAVRRSGRRRRASLVVMHHCVTTLEVPEWMEDPVGDHPQRLMMLVQPPLRAGVRD
ncbi:MAG: hypothetical protein P8185_22110, partial [Deltaproteobacteria bacterium]